MKTKLEWAREAENAIKDKCVIGHEREYAARIVDYLAGKCEELQLALNDLVVRECEDCEDVPFLDQVNCCEKSCPIAKYRNLTE